MSQGKIEALLLIGFLFRLACILGLNRCYVLYALGDMVIDNITLISSRERGFYENISLEIADEGWCVTKNFLPQLLTTQLAEELHNRWQLGNFHHAGIGHRKNQQINVEVRSDQICWLDSSNCTGAQQLYLNALEELRQTLNRNLFLGLFDFEGHLAYYPPGGFYRRHLDEFHAVDQRIVTCILYLNLDWQTTDGGQLLLYTDPQNPDHFEEILPHGGHLVTFLSSRFLYQVMPAQRHRLSITGWFKRRPSLH